MSKRMIIYVLVAVYWKMIFTTSWEVNLFWRAEQNYGMY